MNSCSLVLMLFTFCITFTLFINKQKQLCWAAFKCCAEQHGVNVDEIATLVFFPQYIKGVFWSWINSWEQNRFLHTALIVIVTSSIFSTIWIHIAPIWIYIPTTSLSVSPTVWKESIFPLSVYELHYDPAGFDCHGSSTSQIQRLLA